MEQLRRRSSEPALMQRDAKYVFPFVFTVTASAFPTAGSAVVDQLAKIHLSERTTAIPLEAELFRRGCRRGPSPTLIYSERCRSAAAGMSLSLPPPRLDGLLTDRWPPPLGSHTARLLQGGSLGSA